MNAIEFLVIGLPVWVAVGWWFREAHRGLFQRKPNLKDRRVQQKLMDEHLEFLVNCPKWHGGKSHVDS
jgi:hypothetical protein